MPRARSPSSSPRSNRRRPPLNQSFRNNKYRDGSSESPKRGSSNRRIGTDRRRSPPRRPKSPPGKRRELNKKSLSPGSSTASSVGRSSTRSSSSSASRSKSSSRSSSSSGSYSSSASSSPRKVGKNYERTTRRASIPRKPDHSTVKRQEEKRKSPVQDKRSHEPVRKEKIVETKINEKTLETKPVSRSRFHDKKSPSASPPRIRKNRRSLSESRRAKVSSEKREQPPKSEATTVHVSNITRNIKEEHLNEIFNVYGKVVEVDLPLSVDLKLPRGYARIKYEKNNEANLAKEHMDGGQIDGNTITVDILPSHARRSPEVGKQRARLPSIERRERPRQSPIKNSSRRRLRSSSSSHIPHRRR
ncbi:LOW QUALITY PROTEIN: hypothetical protein HZS_4211 [Henneguya salminicola]|nr:LOW QUALITY PROTEIN: hypothetical protein HZS_4211 [Henneguya salminicola]